MIGFSGRIIVTIVCLGLVVVIHEFGHFLVARWLGVRVERFTVGFGPEIIGWTRGNTRYAICCVPLGGMVKLAGEFMDDRTQAPDEFFSQPWYRRSVIALAGPAMNYLLSFILFALVAGVWGVFQPSTLPLVGDIVPGLPAAEAHLQSGDKIVQIDKTPVATWDDMATMIHGKAEQHVNLSVERKDAAGTTQTLHISIIPKRDPQQGVGLIGIVPQIDKIKPSLRGCVSDSLHQIKVWTLQPLKYLSQSVSHFQAPKELSGPLGIAQMVTKATKEGASYVIYLIAIISTGLGLFNLFPIPVLDGGHVFLYTIEGILRRPLSRRAMQTANAIGLSLVLTIFIYASYQDVLRWHK